MSTQLPGYSGHPKCLTIPYSPEHPRSLGTPMACTPPAAPHHPQAHLSGHQLCLLFVLSCPLVGTANFSHEIIDGAAEESDKGSSQGVTGPVVSWGDPSPAAHPQQPRTLQMKSPLNACPTPRSWPGGRQRSRRSGRCGPGERTAGWVSQARMRTWCCVHPLSTGTHSSPSPAMLTPCHVAPFPQHPPSDIISGWQRPVPTSAHLDVGVSILLLLQGWWGLLRGFVGQHAPPAKQRAEMPQSPGPICHAGMPRSPQSSPVQHLGGGPLQLLQDLQQLRIVIAEAAPAQHPCQVITSAQGQDAQLTLQDRDGVQPRTPPAGTPHLSAAGDITMGTSPLSPWGGEDGEVEVPQPCCPHGMKMGGGSPLSPSFPLSPLSPLSPCHHSLACAAPEHRSQTAPTPRCHRHRTPGCGKWRTSGRGAAWKKGAEGAVGSHWAPAGDTHLPALTPGVGLHS